jgi:hypothetical protein
VKTHILQGSHIFHKKKFNLRNLNGIEGKEKYFVDVSTRFAAMENLDAEVEINKIWETIRENIKITVKQSLDYYELKQHKPWFDERCSKLLDQKKQAKLQRLQDPNEINGDSLNNIRRETAEISERDSEVSKRQIKYV